MFRPTLAQFRISTSLLTTALSFGDSEGLGPSSLTGGGVGSPLLAGVVQHHTSQDPSLHRLKGRACCEPEGDAGSL